MVIKIEEVEDRSKLGKSVPVFVRATLKNNRILIYKGFHIYLLKDDKVYVSQKHKKSI